MRTVNDIINADIELKSGETRIEEGQLAMCITPFASYGGGSGALWAVENQCVQFTTEAHPTYMEGICRKVNPRSRTVAIEITRGPTWGSLAMGDTAILPISVLILSCPSCGTISMSPSALPRQEPAIEALAA